MIEQSASHLVGPGLSKPLRCLRVESRKPPAARGTARHDLRGLLSPVDNPGLAEISWLEWGRPRSALYLIASHQRAKLRAYRFFNFAGS
jgi:hypothetical protein